MEANIPEVLAEVTELFQVYEKALIANDVAVLDKFFWRSPHALRYGVAENLYGYDEIAAFRASRNPGNLDRTIRRSVITTYGRDFATTNIEFVRDTPKVGRQSQTWMRTPEGWKIVTAHVSLMLG